METPVSAIAASLTTAAFIPQFTAARPPGFHYGCISRSLHSGSRAAKQIVGVECARASPA
jgi:hypothetical protein